MMYFLIFVILFVIVVAGITFKDKIIELFMKEEECKDCDKPVQEKPNDQGPIPVTKSISVFLAPINSNPKIPVDTVCTYSDGLKANVTSTGICADCIKYEWYDNAVLIPGQTSNMLRNVPVYRFKVNHFITCKVSGEGVEAVSKPVKLL